MADGRGAERVLACAVNVLAAQAHFHQQIAPACAATPSVRGWNTGRVFFLLFSLLDTSAVEGGRGEEEQQIPAEVLPVVQKQRLQQLHGGDGVSEGGGCCVCLAQGNKRANTRALALPSPVLFLPVGCERLQRLDQRIGLVDKHAPKLKSARVRLRE